MRKLQLTAILLAVLGAAALTACGSDPITTDNSMAETAAVTEVTETTAEETEETTTAAEKTTAAEEQATGTATDAAETETTTVTEAAVTTAEQAQQTEAPATQAPQTEAPAPATEAPKQEQHLFDALKIGASAADYRASHNPLDKIESDSCLSGINYEYYYQDFSVLVNVDNGVEKIEIIKLTGAGVSTREGIHVGSKLEDVKKAYGAGDSDDFISKTTADGLLEIILANGVVTEIDLSKA